MATSAVPTSAVAMPAAALPPTGSARTTRPRMAANTGAVATTRHTLTADVYSSAVYWAQK